MGSCPARVRKGIIKRLYMDVKKENVELLFNKTSTQCVIYIFKSFVLASVERVPDQPLLCIL